MKKIMVYAYTYFNLGDDLFIKILSERYPNTRFVINAPKEYKRCFNNNKNIKIIPSDSILVRGINFFFRKLNNKYFFNRLLAYSCDAVVLIGGSLFMQGEDWREDFDHINSMRIKSKPFFLLGSNFGPFNDDKYFQQYKELFKEYTDICFRDMYSYDLFKDLNNVRIADDIIFQIEEKRNHEQGNIVVISVIKPSYRKNLSNYDDIYFKKIKEIAIYFIDRGYNISFMSFCEHEGDNDAIEEILKLIPKEKQDSISKHYYKGNIDETINQIANSTFVIASRFHAMILGWVFNKSVFPIVYSDKMKNVMKDVGFNGLFTDYQNLSSIEPVQVYNCKNINLTDVSKSVKESEKHFEKLDKYLI